MGALGSWWRGRIGSLEQVSLSADSPQLSRRWGPVFTVWLGPRPAVVLCGYAALRDALVLQADTFSGRGAMPVFQRFTRGNGEAQGVEVKTWMSQFG